MIEVLCVRYVIFYNIETTYFLEHILYKNNPATHLILRPRNSLQLGSAYCLGGLVVGVGPML